MFGATLLLLWEVSVRIYSVTPVILPAPSAVAAQIVASGPALCADFVKRIVTCALSGGSLAAARAFAGGEFRRCPANSRDRADFGDVARI